MLDQTNKNELSNAERSLLDSTKKWLRMRGFQQSYLSDDSSLGLEDSLFPPDGRKLIQGDQDYLQ